MIRRVCLGCGRAVAAAQAWRGRCPACRQTTSQRDYGADHQRMRAELALTLPTDCAYGCGKRLTTDSKWVAAHVVDGDPRSPRVASCPSCNARARGNGGRKVRSSSASLTLLPFGEGPHYRSRGITVI